MGTNHGVSTQRGDAIQKNRLEAGLFFGAVADLALASRRCRSHGQRQCCWQQLARTSANGHEPRGLIATWGRHPKKNRLEAGLFFLSLSRPCPTGMGSQTLGRLLGPADRAARARVRVANPSNHGVASQRGAAIQKNKPASSRFFFGWRPHGDSNPGRLREREVS